VDRVASMTSLFRSLAVAAGGTVGVVLVRAIVVRPWRGPGAVAARSDYVELRPAAGSASTAERVRALAGRIERVWEGAAGRRGPVPPGAMELLLAHAAAERTGFGQGWEATGNVGSYQCSTGSTGSSYYDCVPHGDSRPTASGGQVPIQALFRRYKDGVTPDGVSRGALEAGAWDFVHSVTKAQFTALDEVLSGDVLRYARRQYGNHYFEGFNLSPAGLEAYAPWPSRLVADGVPLFSGRGGPPIAGSRPDGTWRPTGATPVPPGAPTPATVAGRVVFYAAAMARALPEIAAALGHPRVEARVARGLEQPWKPSFQAGGGKLAA